MVGKLLTYFHCLQTQSKIRSTLHDFFSQILNSLSSSISWEYLWKHKVYPFLLNSYFCAINKPLNHPVVPLRKRQENAAILSQYWWLGKCTASRFRRRWIWQLKHFHPCFLKVCSLAMNHKYRSDSHNGFILVNVIHKSVLVHDGFSFVPGTAAIDCDRRLGSFCDVAQANNFTSWKIKRVADFLFHQSGNLV